MSRADIKAAPFNPRRIDPHARKKLERNLRRVGLLQPLVWNETTGHLVSGHQRLKCLDAIERRDDYTLDVAVVRLSEAAEREQVVFMNNESAMGHWDSDALSALLGEGLDAEAAGFDAMDLEMLLGDGITAERRVTAGDADAAPAPAAETCVDLDAKRFDEIARIRDAKKASKQRARDRDDTEFYLVVVFRDRDHCTRALDLLGLPQDERYVDGSRVISALEAYYGNAAG